MNGVLGIIPVRYESTRFPGKPLALIGNRPMIQWVVEACQKARKLDRIVVATDDDRIRSAVESFGGEAIMTAKDHATGTDRIVEAALQYPGYNIVVNIQGDEPGIEPDLVDGVVQMKLDHPQWEMSTAARELQPHEDGSSPHRVKVVISRSGRALYFSRSPIPYSNQDFAHPTYVHLGIYAYNRDFLLSYNSLPTSGLEKRETLEQLRAIENDHTIGTHIVENSLTGVDTPKDLENIITEFRKRGMIQ